MLKLECALNKSQNSVAKSTVPFTIVPSTLRQDPVFLVWRNRHLLKAPPNWKCVQRNFNACTSIDVRVFERDSSNQTPTIMFNMCMTQFTCSHHGILICEKITTYLDSKGTSKKTFFLCEQSVEAKTPDFTSGRLYERVKVFPLNIRLVIFTKTFC